MNDSHIYLWLNENKFITITLQTEKNVHGNCSLYLSSKEEVFFCKIMLEEKPLWPVCANEILKHNIQQPMMD